MTGQTIGHYRILEQLGVGGMGIVYKALDTHLDRFVAIKVLPPEKFADPERKRRFVQEAKAASALNHPNIITIHDIASENGIDFIAMEYVPGKALNHLIPRKGLPLSDSLKYAIQIADALAAAHAAGIIHRDLKPGNVMVTGAEGRPGLVKVLDFGLAKLTDRTEANQAEFTETIRQRDAPSTGEGAIIGTISYMSPEQAEGKKVDARSDIFSFGALLYEMVTGQRAFQGDSNLSTLSAILREEPKPASQVVEGLPRELERIIARCLRKSPDRRFQAMPDLKVALEELKEESDSGTLMRPGPPTSPGARRRTGPMLLLGAVVVIVAAAAAWFWWGAKPGKPAQRKIIRLTSTGAASSPAISRDGKLLAYQQALGGLDPDIWVQQIGGGKAIQITHEKGGATSPVFSPHGTQIAYESRSGIHEVPTLGGPPRLITSDGYNPLYTRDGSGIVSLRFVQPHWRLFIVPHQGGNENAIQPELEMYSFPVLSPDGSRMLAMGSRNGSAQDATHWWAIPIAGGKLEEIPAPRLLSGETEAPLPLAWMATEKDSRQWVIFGRPDGDTFNLFRMPISNGTTASQPEQLTFTTGISSGPSISDTGRMVFASGTDTTNLWAIPADTNHARVTGDRQSLTQSEGVRNDSPTLSRDGNMVAFFSGNWLMAKDLTSGREIQLVPDLAPNRGDAPSISPDGTQVVYYRSGAARANSDLYVIPAAGGASRRVCQSCGTSWGFSSDGTRLLTAHSGTPYRIGLVELSTGKFAEALRDTKSNLFNAHYSWDDKWMGFLMQMGPNRFRIYVTPVENYIPAGPDRWVQLTSGDCHDDKQQFSPDGNTMYFTSNRDGSTCLWALRLDPKTKRPLGAPVAVQHFHGSQRIYRGISAPNAMEVNITRDKIVINLDEFHTDIWRMQLDPGK